jgi:hypothetical protein
VCGANYLPLLGTTCRLSAFSLSKTEAGSFTLKGYDKEKYFNCTGTQPMWSKTEFRKIIREIRLYFERSEMREIWPLFREATHEYAAVGVFW